MEVVQRHDHSLHNSTLRAIQEGDEIKTPPARHGLKGGSRHTKEEVQTYTTEHDEIATPTDGSKQRGGYNTAHRAWLTLYEILHDPLYEILHDRTAASISHSIAFVSLTYDTVPKEKRALLKKKGTANVRVEKATAQSSDNGFGRTRHRATILLRASLQRALLQRALKVTHLPLVSATLPT